MNKNPIAPDKIFLILKEYYPDLQSELDFINEYQLFVAVLLSAQCTDKRVNKITPDFFTRFPDFSSLAVGNTSEIETLIRSCGLFHSKSKNLSLAAKKIIKDFDGQLPRSRSELMQLAGIGRKSANVLLSVAMQIPAFPVDTHVGRLSRRLGWTIAIKPDSVERDVTALFPADVWHDLHHALILHGRRVCKSRVPLCSQCPLSEICPRIGV